MPTDTQNQHEIAMGFRQTAMIEPFWAIMDAQGSILLQKIAQVSNGEVLADWMDYGEQPKPEAKNYKVQNGIALINVTGPIFKKEDWYTRWGGGVSSERILQDLRAIETDPTVSKVHFTFDTPGGQTSGTNAVAEQISRLNKMGKMCVATVEDTCCSAGYWWASQCTHIFAQKTSQVGSIGTYMVLYDVSAMYERIGVKAILVASGQFKGMGVPGTKITAQQINKFRENVTAVNDVFVDMVRSGRGYSEEAVQLIATGEVWVGAQAQELGLIDGLKSKEDVLAAMEAGTLPAKRGKTMLKGKDGKFSLTARLLHALNSSDDDDEQEDETEDEEQESSTQPKRTGLFQKREPSNELVEALKSAGITTVAQLSQRLEMAELGDRFRAEAIEYATAQAVRRYGEKGAKVAARLKSASMEDIEASAASWEAEADEKYGIGKDGTQSGRVSKARALRGGGDDSTYAQETDAAAEELTEERRVALMGMTQTGRNAIGATNHTRN